MLLSFSHIARASYRDAAYPMLRRMILYTWLMGILLLVLIFPCIDFRYYTVIDP